MTEVPHAQTRMIAVLTISVFFDLVLSVGLGWVAWRQDALTKENARNSSAAVVGCEASNRAIDNQKALWQPLLDSSPPPSTPIEVEQRRKFQTILDTPATDCSKL